MITEELKLIASMINIIVISTLVYKKKYGLAWVLAIGETLALLIN